ncbi:MAG: ClbS/DfsB family four-helix bundle protein [Roseivirga sp.]|nr:ClbS/DfsB family four-helix bundle protein [Roseivirga sp.]
MPRPKNKEELLDLGEKNFQKLHNYIDGLSPEQQTATFPEGYLNRNIPDVLMHLHEWHLMLLGWYEAGITGKKPEMPAKGYTWKSMPELNRKIQEQYADTSLAEAQATLSDSYQQIRSTIEKHTNEELFEKKRYKWTGSTSMGAYFISATASHYDWAFKLVKKCLKV